MRRKFLFLFFLSGISGLIYEVIWMKLLSRLFGVSSFATGTVLSVFMLGLALGSFLFTDVSGKFKSPRKVFIWLEIGIALSALAIPHMLQVISASYAVSIGEVSPTFAEISMYRLIGSLIVLTVPTVLMGGTLPIMAKILYRKGKLGNDVAVLYSANTFGAVIGAVLAGFFLVDKLGILFSNYAAITINGVVIFIAALSRYKIPKKAVCVPKSLGEEEKKKSRMLCLIIATTVSGFVSLGLETIWTRIFSLMFHNTVYAFSTILATFLFGIALGSLFVKKWFGNRKRSWGIYGAFQILFGILSLILIPLFGQVFVLFESLGGENLASGWIGVSLVKFFICFVAILLPTMLLGATFPMGCRILENITGKDRANPSALVGIYSGFNTVGAVMGAFAVSFILVPTYGTQNVAIWLFYAIVASGVLMVFLEKESGWREKLILLSLAVGFVAGCINTSSLFDITFRNQAFGSHYETYFSMEDESGLTEVLYDRNSGVKKLVTNRQQQEGDNSYESVYSQKKQGYLPMLLKPNAKNIAVIGLGTGISLAPIPHFLPSRVDCLEISTGVVEASYMFKSENQNILKNPRLNVIQEDGRNYLVNAARKYDLIIADLFTPYRASVGNIYSLEHYEVCKSRMAEDGMMVQWLPLHQLTLNTFKIITKTFTSVFPHATLWVTKQSVALIACEKPLVIDFDWMKKALTNRRIVEDLKDFGLLDPYGFLDSYLVGEFELRHLCSGAVLNTDDMPVVEYLSPKEFDIKKSEKNYYKILEKLIKLGSEVKLKKYDKAVYDKIAVYKNAKLAVYRAKIARSKKQYDKSIAFYKEAWTTRNDEREARKFLENHYITRGNQVYKQGRIENGVNVLREALIYNPHSILAHSNIATIYFVDHQYDKSIEWWKKLLVIYPENFEAKQGIQASNERKEFFQKQAARETRH